MRPRDRANFFRHPQTEETMKTRPYRVVGTAGPVIGVVRQPFEIGRLLSLFRMTTTFFTSLTIFSPCSSSYDKV